MVCILMGDALAYQDSLTESDKDVNKKENVAKKWCWFASLCSVYRLKTKSYFWSQGVLWVWRNKGGKLSECCPHCGDPTVARNSWVRPQARSSQIILTDVSAGDEAILNDNAHRVESSRGRWWSVSKASSTVVSMRCATGLCLLTPCKNQRLVKNQPVAFDKEEKWQLHTPINHPLSNKHWRMKGLTKLYVPWETALFPGTTTWNPVMWVVCANYTICPEYSELAPKHLSWYTLALNRKL